MLALATVAAAILAVVAPAGVTAIGADGPRVAYATADCGVRLWDRWRIVAFGRDPACEATSTATAVAAVAVAGSRVAWLHHTGGHVGEWSLWTATPTRRAPRRLAFATAEPDAAAPIVLGEGDRDLLPYAVRDTAVVLHANGARAYAWKAPARVTAVAAQQGQVVVATRDGSATILDADGRVVQTERFDGPATAVRLTRGGLVAEVGRTLELRSPAGARSYPLPAHTVLADAAGGIAILVGGGRVQGLDLVTGGRAQLGPGAAAQLELPWLTIADSRRVSSRRL